MADPASRATYVFCLMQSDRVPSLGRAPASLPGAGAPRPLLIARGLWAVVADAPLPRFSKERLQEELQDLDAVSRYVVAHAAVVEFAFRRAPVIPLKLFTLFASDQRTREALSWQARKLLTSLDRLRGLEEWGVRVIGAAKPAPVRAATAVRASGRGYLETKRQLRALTNASKTARPPAEIGSAMRAIGGYAAKTRKEVLPAVAGAHVSGASFLVKASRRVQWRKLVARHAALLKKKGHRVELSGPWPPYHFVG